MDGEGAASGRGGTAGEAANEEQPSAGSANQEGEREVSAHGMAALWGSANEGKERIEGVANQHQEGQQKTNEDRGGAWGLANQDEDPHTLSNEDAVPEAWASERAAVTDASTNEKAESSEAPANQRATHEDFSSQRAAPKASTNRRATASEGSTNDRAEPCKGPSNGRSDLEAAANSEASNTERAALQVSTNQRAEFPDAPANQRAAPKASTNQSSVHHLPPNEQPSPSQIPPPAEESAAQDPSDWSVAESWLWGPEGAEEDEVEPEEGWAELEEEKEETAEPGEWMEPEGAPWVQPGRGGGTGGEQWWLNPDSSLAKWVVRKGRGLARPGPGSLCRVWLQAPPPPQAPPSPAALIGRWRCLRLGLAEGRWAAAVEEGLQTMAAGEWAWLCPARAGPPGAFLGVRLGSFSQATPLWTEPWAGRWAAAQERRRRAEQLLAEGAVGAAARAFSQALRVAAAAMTPAGVAAAAAVLLGGDQRAAAVEPRGSEVKATRTLPDGSPAAMTAPRKPTVAMTPRSESKMAATTAPLDGSTAAMTAPGGSTGATTPAGMAVTPSVGSTVAVTTPGGSSRPMSPWEAALTLKAELHAQLALCQLRLGLPAAAAANAGKALQLQPRHLEARYRRGVAAAATGDLEAAAEDLRAVLRAEPGHTRAGQELRRVRGAARQRDAGLARRLGRLFA